MTAKGAKVSGSTKPRKAVAGLMPPGKPSLKTLAAHLGLSVATVSRVLSAAPAARSIPKVTQDRIRAAAETMQYRPNVLARSLRRKTSMTIGVMVPEVSEGYATLVLSGLEEHLLAAHYVYILVSHHHREDLIEQCQSLLLARAVDAIIAIDTPLKRRSGVPTVTVSGHHEAQGVTNIVLDHRRAAELAIDHLHVLGHRDIAFIKGQSFSSDTEVRWEAIRHAMAARKLRIAPTRVTRLEGDAPPSHDPGYLATRRLLANGSPFTALFAFNDISAIGAVRALRDAGLRVPEDVSVVGFDDVLSAAYQNPALTTVRQPLATMGALAAQQVLEQIASADHAAVQQIVVTPELIVRGSTGAVNPQAPAR